MPAVFSIPVVISLGVTMLVCFENKRKQRRKWSKRWLLDRNTYSVVNLLRELKTNEPADYQNH
jgi:hypothetical protein